VHVQLSDSIPQKANSFLEMKSKLTGIQKKDQFGAKSWRDGYDTDEEAEENNINDHITVCVCV
jgi:hypothetical protein